MQRSAKTCMRCDYYNFTNNNNNTFIFNIQSDILQNNYKYSMNRLSQELNLTAWQPRGRPSCPSNLTNAATQRKKDQSTLQRIRGHLPDVIPTLSPSGALGAEILIQFLPWPGFEPRTSHLAAQHKKSCSYHTLEPINKSKKFGDCLLSCWPQMLEQTSFFSVCG